MNTIRWFQVFLLLLCAISTCQVIALEDQGHKGSLDSVTIEKLTGAKGKLDAAENVFKVSVPGLTLP